MLKKLTVLGLMGAGVSSFATGSLSAATQRIASEIGTQAVITATLTCDLTAMGGSSGGNLGTVNQVLCMMNNQSFTATTGATGVTKTVTVSGQTITVHTVLNAPGPTINGTTYAYELKGWSCNTSTNCSSTTDFLPSIYAVFNSSSSGATNNGILINHFGAYTGLILGSAFIQWDTGTSTTNKFFNLEMVDCSQSPTTAILASYTRTGTVSSMDDLVSQASGAVTRTAVAWDNTANTGNWYQDAAVSAGGDSPAWAGGFTRTTTSTDFTYSTASAGSFTILPFPTQIAGATLSGATYQGVSCSSITSTGVPTVSVGTGILSTPLTSATNGMATNPPNI